MRSSHTLAIGADWSAATQALTVQGDAFSNSFDLGNIHGGNLLSRWSKQLGPNSELEIQGYYDQVHRDVNKVFDALDTFDFTLQHSVGIGSHQQLVWGLGHRVTHDQFINNLNAFVLVPDHDRVELSNAFAQDTLVTSAHTKLTVGAKLEYSSFSGWEVLPNARFAWTATNNVLLWAAISRASRTPSRIDRELTFPGLVDQATKFASESVIAYEVGYRGQPAPNASVSVSLFYNDYKKLRMLTVLPNGHFMFDNAMEGYTYGAELTGDYQLADWWRVSAGATFLEKRLELAANAFIPVFYQHAGNDSRHQFFFRSSMDLLHQIELDIALWSIGEQPNPSVPGYVEADVRLGCKINNRFQLSVIGANLLHDQHPETRDPAARNDLRRSVHLETLTGSCSASAFLKELNNPSCKPITIRRRIPPTLISF